MIKSKNNIQQYSFLPLFPTVFPSIIAEKFHHLLLTFGDSPSKGNRMKNLVQTRKKTNKSRFSPRIKPQIEIRVP